MGGSAYSSSNHYTSMSQNRKLLDISLAKRDKVWTGNDTKMSQLKVDQSNRSLESTEVESKPVKDTRRSVQGSQSTRKDKVAALRYQAVNHRYKNSSTINQHHHSVDYDTRNKGSIGSHFARKPPLDRAAQKFLEVNASVDAHLKKFDYLIPDLRKKKFDLMAEIMGEKPYAEMLVRLKRK